MDNRIFTSHTETRILSKILILCKLKIMASWGYFITPNHWCCSCSFSGSSFIPSIWTILQWRLSEGWRPLKNWRIQIWHEILCRVEYNENLELFSSTFFGANFFTNFEYNILWLALITKTIAFLESLVNFLSENV